MDPSYFIGGVSPDLPNSFHVTSLESGHRFVLEGDEYDTAYWDKVPKFNHYLPDHVILSSIEYDHADIYPDLGAVIKAFEGLVARVRPGGHMIACYDYEHVRQVCSQAQVPVYSYGLKQGRFRAQAIQTIEGKASFEITDDGKLLGKLEMSLTGEHNVLNALSVFIECRQLGLSLEKIQSGLAGFRGVRRRQEERGEIGGVLVIDDFAHHPTAVRETLRGLKKKYPGRRVLTVFEPRSATSRRKVFQKDYVEALSEADLVYIASPYDQSKISQSDQFSSEQLVQDLHGLGKKAESFSKVESGVSSVVGQAQAGDLVAVLSNGGFDGFIAKLLIALKEWE
jgi:UDP-N-acetylmuramate: L-alanyl-gamma-D-glutamyl-meso-diaminopimelate ligase